MDDRQRQIKEGAGLEESRINKDFLDWLLKWGPVLVLVAAGIILAMRGVQFLEDRRVARVNEGFSELERVSEGVTVNPNSISSMAEDFDDVRGVGAMGRLRAGEAYLRAVRAGLDVGVDPRPGNLDTMLGPDGGLKNPEQALTEEEKKKYLGQIESLGREVLSKTENKPGMWVHRLHAIFLLASVSESREDYDRAREWYEQAAGEAERVGDVPHAEIARERIESLDELASLPRYYSAAELPGEIEGMPVTPAEIGPMITTPGDETPVAGEVAEGAQEGEAESEGGETPETPDGSADSSSEPPAEPTPDSP